jgi:flagellar biosynthesis protein FlhF
MSEMEAVRRELEAMRRTISWHIGANGHSIPELSLAEALLTEADFAADLKEELLTALDVRLRQEALYNQAKVASTGDKRLRVRGRAMEATSSDMEERSASLLREQLGMMLETAPCLGSSKDAPRAVVAVVGPPGSGKTTAIVKLAIQYGLSSRRPTAIISADGYRVGATEQLRMYAAAMGIAFQAVETATALRQALEEHRNKGLVLIDTPGFAPADMDAASDLARFLSSQPEIDVHLLLPATYRASNLAKVTQEFAMFGANKAMLTKLDEAESNGAALSHAILANLPVSFVTAGQRIPEDLKVADKDQLLSFLNEAERSVARSAA